MQARPRRAVRDQSRISGSLSGLRCGIRLRPRAFGTKAKASQVEADTTEEEPETGDGSVRYALEPEAETVFRDGGVL